MLRRNFLKVCGSVLGFLSLFSLNNLLLSGSKFFNRRWFFIAPNKQATLALIGNVGKKTKFQTSEYGNQTSTPIGICSLETSKIILKNTIKNEGGDNRAYKALYHWYDKAKELEKEELRKDVEVTTLHIWAHYNGIK